jgi:peptide/nickel transport system permease protein
LRYILRRFLLLLLTGWVAITLNFAIPRLMPGNPIEAMAVRYGGKLAPSELSALAIELGLKSRQNEVAQYFTYLGHTLTGNLGYSLYSYPERVSTIIGESLPWTIFLVGASTILAFVIGTSLGAIAAWRRGKPLDSALVPTGVMLGATPAFWIATLALYFLAFRLNLFPVYGGSGINEGLVSFSGIGSIIDHAALPGITLTAISLGGYLLLMRNTTITVLSDDFVKFARAKGLRDRVVATHYAARNAILPNFTTFALALGFVVSGAIVIEYVFDYPGVGYELFTAVLNYDYPLMQGLFLIIVIGVLIANFLADLLYVLLDPRIRMGARS